MPCAGMKRRWKAKPRSQKVLVIKRDEPFFQAAMEYAKLRKWPAPKTVSMVGEGTLLITFRSTNAATGWRYFKKVGIDTLHDMAHKYLPEPDPKKPLLMEDFLDRLHVKPPKESEVMKPLPQLRRVFKRVETADGYMFDVEFVPVVKPKAPVVAEDKKKKAMTTKRMVVMVEEE